MKNMDKIFDPTRRKYVAATPEEKVRQDFIRFLQSKGFPLEIIKTEVSLEFAGLRRRADIVIYQKQKPWIIVECKAPSVNITRETFEQIWQYFYSLDAEFLVLTNSKKIYLCHVDSDKKCNFLDSFPTYLELKSK